MSYTKLMIFDKQDQTDKPLEEYVKTVTGVEFEEDFKQDLSQCLTGKNTGDIYTVLAIDEEDLMTEIINQSSLIASRPQLENTPDFDFIRFSNDEKWFSDSQLENITNDLLGVIQAYINDIETPLQKTNIWDFIKEGETEEENETLSLGDHFVFILKFPPTWPTQFLTDLKNKIVDYLAFSVLGNYWLIKGSSDLSNLAGVYVQLYLDGLKTVLMKRKKPIRRKASFFS